MKIHITPGKAKEKLAEEPIEKFITLLRHGSMSVEYYKPEGKDYQTPHQQDELYVIISGSATFFCNNCRIPCAPHDVLFAPAGAEHRFENFTNDFATWVIFYGPDGGESA